MKRPPPTSTLFPYTTLFRSGVALYTAVHFPDVVDRIVLADGGGYRSATGAARSEEHTSELQSPDHLVCRLLLEKKKARCIQLPSQPGAQHLPEKHTLAWHGL